MGIGMLALRVPGASYEDGDEEIDDNVHLEEQAELLPSVAEKIER